VRDGFQVRKHNGTPSLFKPAGFYLHMVVKDGYPFLCRFMYMMKQLQPCKRLYLVTGCAKKNGKRSEKTV
jgi:hypothetical protein